MRLAATSPACRTAALPGSTDAGCPSRTHWRGSHSALHRTYGLPAVPWLGACNCPCAQRQQGLSSGWTWRRGCSRSVPICWGGPVTAALMLTLAVQLIEDAAAWSLQPGSPWCSCGVQDKHCHPAVQLNGADCCFATLQCACRRRLLPCSTHCRNVQEQLASACASSESHLLLPDLACLALHPACLPDCWQADSCLCSHLPSADNTPARSCCVGSALRTLRLPRRLCARARRTVLVQCGRTTTQATRMRAWSPGCARSLLPRELRLNC